MTLAYFATDADSRLTDWHLVDGSKVNRYVRRLQTRIVKAVKQGKWRLVKNRQRLLSHSICGCLLAVRRVTENRGKKTPGGNTREEDGSGLSVAADRVFCFAVTTY